MGDFIHPQLLECCKISMPDGLRELMADISREVLRAQPKNLYKFIADYLAALLVTRENLTIACQICGDLCENTCHTILIEELKGTGFDDDTAVVAAETITNYFANGEYKGSILMQKLMKAVDVRTDQLEGIKVAIHNTFLRQKIKSKLIDNSDEVEDAVVRAVTHTMKLYDQTSPSEEQSCKMARKIQAAYKGYNVRRNRKTTSKKPVDVFKFSLRDNRSASYFDLENIESYHQSEDKLSSAEELAEIVEIEFATFDYTHSGPITIKKPKIYDRKSRENLLSVQFEDPQEEIVINKVASAEEYHCNRTEIPEEIEHSEDNKINEIEHFEEHDSKIEHLENYKKIEEPTNETIQEATTDIIVTKFVNTGGGSNDVVILDTKCNHDDIPGKLRMKTSDNAVNETDNVLRVKESVSININNQERSNDIHGIKTSKEESEYSNTYRGEINSKSLSIISERNDEIDSDQEIFQ